MTLRGFISDTPRPITTKQAAIRFRMHEDCRREGLSTEAGEQVVDGLYQLSDGATMRQKQVIADAVDYALRDMGIER